MTQANAHQREVRFPATRLLFAVTFLLVFALYGFTLAPGVVGGDAGEHQLAVPLLGIPHTTGYPLYILTGKLWTLLIPFGSPAWRVNLFSALGGALAAALTSLVIYRLTNEVRRSRHPGVQNAFWTPGVAVWPGALVGGLALAFGLTLWQWSTIAGVRSFNIFFFALLTLQAVTFAQQRRAGDDRAASRTLAWLALTVGLSLAHHRTTVFYLPSLVGWVGWHDRRLIFRPRQLLPLIGLALAPLLFYLFIYLRGVTGPPYTHEQITDLASFWFLVGSGDSSGLFLSIDPAFLPARLSFIWGDVLAQLAWPGVGLALIGAVALLRRRPVHFFLQALLVLLLLWFTLDFEVVNLTEAPTWYLMPAYFIFAVWLGLGLNTILDIGFWILDSIRSRATPKFTFYVSRFTTPFHYSHLRITHYELLISAIALALLITTLAWPNWQLQHAAATAPLDEWRQLLRGTQARRFIESSLPQVKPNSIIWGDWEQYTPLKYAQLIEGRRPDLTVRNPLDNWPEKVAAARAAGQPIYFSRKPADLIGTPYLSMAGPLIYLGREPSFELPPDLTPLQATFEDQLELLGYRAEIIPQPWADPILQLHLAWRVPQKVAWDYALSLRLLDAAGQEIHKQDATHPVLSSYPTSLWTPGEVVLDFYELPFPTEKGPLSLHLLPYRSEGPGQWHNLRLNETGQEGVRLGPFGE